MPKNRERIRRIHTRFHRARHQAPETAPGKARAKRQQHRAAIVRRKQEEASNATFQQAAQLWLADGQIREKGSTYYRYQYLLNRHILPELGPVPLEQITSTAINTFLAGKRDHGRLDGKGGLSPAYVRSMSLVILAVMNFAVANQMCQPLATKISKPAAAAREMEVLSPAEQKQLEQACLSQPDETKLGILLSLYAGLRIGEVCALEWSDIDLHRKVIHVRKTVTRVWDPVSGRENGSRLTIDQPKTTASYRDIPLGSWLVPLLEAGLVQEKQGYVISGGPAFLSPRTYGYRYHKVLASAGLPPKNYHTLRHTFATRCIEAGVDVKTLSELLGHANVSITLNTYVHSSFERKRSQLEKLHPD